MKSTAILIPARYNSTRYPGKPLIDLNGLTMIQRVYNTCKQVGCDVFVLTDDTRIASLFPDSYVDASDYDNGTERCAGAIKNEMFSHYQYFINVQGDMPDVTPEIIETAAECLNYADVGTVYTTMSRENQNDPNSVKLIYNAKNHALWFGRGITGYGNWHLGVYSYSREALSLYPGLGVYPEERIEKLEQLRWLKNGWQIACLPVSFNGVEINTPEDRSIWLEKNKMTSSR
jgi:3-deoxy-manno-octulosonate cytidylyltransferase (CMP-KDO synthetase)